MRLTDESLPKLIAAGVTLLVAPLLWSFLDSGTTAPDPAEQEAAAEELFGARGEIDPLADERIPLDDIAPLLERIRTAPEESYGAILPHSEQLGEYAPEAIAAIVASLESRLAEDPGSTLLEAEAQVLRHAIERLIMIEDPGVSLMRLRQRAITAGGTERFRAVVEPLFLEPRLARWLSEHDRTDPVWILDSAVLLREPEIVHRWAEVLFREKNHAPSLELTTEWARSLAFLVGSTGDPRAREILDEVLRVESLAARPGGVPGNARRVALWLRSVVSIAQVEQELDGDPGQAAVLEDLGNRIEAAILGIETVLRIPHPPEIDDPGLPARLVRRATLDLSRARILAAHIQERRTALPSTETSESRARKLLRIGRNALERGDREELNHVIDLLERSSAAFHHRLLSAGRARRDGVEHGRRALVAALDADAALAPSKRFLFPAEEERWRRFAEHGRFATLTDVPALLFESGKLWAELGTEGRRWLDRTLRQLRTNLESPRDQKYLSFLEARVALGEGRTEGSEENLLRLLDEGPPPGLARAEIGGLLVLIEERADQLAGAGVLRDQIREETGAIIRDAPYDLEAAEAARVLAFRSERAAAPPTTFADEAVVRTLDGFVERLTDGTGLVLDLALERMRLSQEMFRTAERLAEEGELDLASDLLDRVASLTGESTDLWRARGELERERALGIRDDDPERARGHWRAAARAFHRVALDDPDRSELLIDATRAAIEGGELEYAQRLATAAEDTRGIPGEDASQRLDAILLQIRIDRLLGRAENVLAATQSERFIDWVSTPVEQTIQLDRAWAFEELGDEESALAVLGHVLDALGPTSPDWRRAVFERARILEGRVTGGTDPASREALARARKAWGEAATWLSPTDRERPADLAVACLHAAEHSIELGELAAARRYIVETLFEAEDAFLASDPRRGERERWDSVTERALYTLGDIHRAANRPDLARETFEDALDRYPGSVRVPVAYLMLGILAEERGDPDEALGLYRRGIRKADALAEDADLEPTFDVKQKLEARIRRIESTR